MRFVAIAKLSQCFNFLNILYIYYVKLCTLGCVVFEWRFCNSTTSHTHTQTHIYMRITYTHGMQFIQTRNLCCWQLKLACKMIIYFRCWLAYENREKCHESDHKCENGQNPKHTARSCAHSMCIFVLYIYLCTKLCSVHSKEDNIQTSPPSASLVNIN